LNSGLFFKPLYLKLYFFTLFSVFSAPLGSAGATKRLMTEAKSTKEMPAKDKSSFGALPLGQDLIQVTRELGFTQMTPIQSQSIPLLLQGRDLIGQSKTGSGKTAAFSLPILEKIELRSRRIQALILCPTRELCTQVAREIRRLGRRHSGLQVLILSGGQPIFPQLCALEKGAHMVVGTPGRVLDHLKRKTLELGDVTTLVLDEADRMLDMGFEKDMEAILRKVPESRQTVLFSATFPKTIEAMSRTYQKNPARVTIQDERQAAPQIRQVLYEANPDLKVNGLLWLLQQNKPESAIVFCNLKASVSELTQTLVRAGVAAECLHGDLEQEARDRVMAKFRNRSCRVLVATDVAARGIDVEDLDAVFNFDLPPEPEVYVHRIGRTGRAGKRGIAISMATSREKNKVQNIERYTGTPFDRKTLAPVANLDREAFSTVLRKEAEMATLYISGGRKEKLRPGDILGALTGEAGGFSGEKIGKIEIHDRFAYVAIAKPLASLALQRLRDGRIKGRKFHIEIVR
jgi:ATP-independent RNA helicase DbpA